MGYFTMKKFRVVLSSVLILMISLMLASCDKKEQVYSKDAFMMGTVINLKYYGKNGEKAIEESINRISEIEKEMSLNIEDSEICDVNENAGVKPIKVSDDVFKVVEKSLYYGELSGGALDISIRPVDALWSIGSDNERVPENKEIKKALQSVDYKNIELDSDNNTVFLKNKSMAIDLGSIAKGYTADELVNILKKYNVDRAFINLGGNLYVHGGKENNQPLNIGIQDPKGDKGEYFGVLKVEDKSVVTSENYERYFIEDGKRYHHIMDPKTGYPSENGVISTTIISDKSIDDDALSTSTYVLGVEKGMELINSIEGVDAIFVTDDNKVYTSKGINESNFDITNKEYTYEKGR